MQYRVGIGYDIHRLTEGRKFILGGVEIPYLKGLFGHSDADALIHAVCDALLGAAGEGDIGEHFPDTDSRYEGISSIELLREVMSLISKKGFKVSNVDTVVVAQEPSLAPFKKQIRTKLAHTLGLKESSVGVKAKTNEGLDAAGRREAVACYAVAILTAEE